MRRRLSWERTPSDRTEFRDMTPQFRRLGVVRRAVIIGIVGSCRDEAIRVTCRKTGTNSRSTGTTAG